MCCTSALLIAVDDGIETTNFVIYLTVISVT